MVEKSFEAAVRQAFREANVDEDCEFSFEITSVACAAMVVVQCIVEYKSGNEYIRLDKLISKIKAYGDIKLIELRGRGANDAPKLVIESKFEGKTHQVIYLLPND